MAIQSIKIQNYKSIRETQEILINPINVLIGSNGVGKSNFIGFFKFLNRLFEKQLQNHIARKGYADSLMYFGKKSRFISGEIVFRNNEDKISNRYRFKMEPNESNSLFFTEEFSDYNMQAQLSNFVSWSTYPINTGGTSETKLHEIASSTRTDFLKRFFESFKVFHFHDTSDSSKLKGFCNTTDYEHLVEDGSNLPAFLYRMKEKFPQNYKLLEFTIKSIAPFIDALYLQPDQLRPDLIELRWKEKGHDNLFNSYSLSDGTLRFICLCTLLLQPVMPSTIIIDEPELGLHPSAISKLSALIKSASSTSQIIVSTQSVNLIDHFNPEDILVVDRADNQTVFKRLSKAELADWLDNYTLGQLWRKNIIGGRP